MEYKKEMKVKLSRLGKDTCNKGKDRFGIVATNPTNQKLIAVKWDNNIHPDRMHHSYIEPCEE